MQRRAMALLARTAPARAPALRAAAAPASSGSALLAARRRRTCPAPAAGVGEGPRLHADAFTKFWVKRLADEGARASQVRRSCCALSPMHPCASMLRVLGGHGRQMGGRVARDDDTVQPVFSGAATRPCAHTAALRRVADAHSSSGGQHRLLGSAWGSAYPASWPGEPAGAGLTRALHGGRGAGSKISGLAHDGGGPGGGAAAAARQSPRVGPAVYQPERRDGGAGPGRRAGRERGRGRRRPRRGAPQRRRRVEARRRRIQGARARGAPPLVVSCACSWSSPAPPFTIGS